MLGGPANVVLAEGKSDQHDMPKKGKRKLLASSSQFKPLITVTTGKLATIVEMRSQFFGGGELRRVIRFYNDSPRIDCTTETNGLPDGTILSVEFPLADDVTEMRRGIPFGFSHGDCVNGVPGVTGLTKSHIAGDSLVGLHVQKWRRLGHSRPRRARPRTGRQDGDPAVAQRLRDLYRSSR